MVRSFKLSNKTTRVLIVVNLILLASIFTVAFNNPFAVGSNSDAEDGAYGLNSELAWNAAEEFDGGIVTKVMDERIADAPSGHPCVIALEQSARLSLNMYGSSSLVAPQCTIHSHSTSPFGVNLESVDKLEVAAVYSGGSIGRRNSTPGLRLIPHANAVVDPLAGIQTPQIEKCDHQDLVLKKGRHRLLPGVYCGGIVSLTSDEIELAPGIYTIKNGPLAIGGKASFVGDGVSIVFDGPNAVFSFGVATKLALTAPISGPMAGIIFFERSDSPKNREFVVRSHDAGLVEGTIYLPRGKFVVDSYGRVGQSSNWSAIVANQIEIINGAQLQINTDHAASDVPLPTYLKQRRDLAVAFVE